MKTTSCSLALIIVVVNLFSLKINAQPAIEWQKLFGGGYSEYAYSILQTNDGGYIIAGSTSSNDADVSGNHWGTPDCWIVKLNSSGNITWQKCLGGILSDGAGSIQQTTDSGYIVAGSVESNDGDVSGNHGVDDFWVVKLTAGGNITWSKCLGGSMADEASSVQQTTDGGYIVAGLSASNDGDVSGNHGGNSDYWIVKLNNSGNITWQECLGGSGADDAHSIQQTTDGGYIVAGRSASMDGDVIGNHKNYNHDYWILKLSASGTIEWQKCLGGTDHDEAYSIQQTTDGGYIAAGRSFSIDGDVTGNHGEDDYWVVKLDSSGNITWQKSLGGSSYDNANSIQQTTDSGYIVAGTTYSPDGDVTGKHGGWDCWIVKLNSSGTMEWQKCMGGNEYDFGTSAVQTTDGGYIIAGYSNSNDSNASGNHGIYDYLVTKLSPLTNIAEQGNNGNLISIYPNPAAGQFSISLNKNFKIGELNILNVIGEKVYSASFTGRQATINTGLTAGVYFVLVRDGEKQWTEKIISE